MEMQINKRKIYTVIVLIYLFLFSTVLEDYVLIFKYFDECFALMACLVFIKSRRHRKDELKLLLILVLFVGWTLIANIIFQYQDFKVALGDAFLNIKFWCALYIGIEMAKTYRIEAFKTIICNNIRFITVLFFILFLLDNIIGLFTPIIREGLRSTHLFYWQPTYLVAYCVWMIMILISLDNRKRNYKYIVILLILMCTSYRSKAIAAALLFIIIYYLAYIRKKKITIKTFLMILPVMILVGWDQIYWYFFSPIRVDSARNVLTWTSLEIAKKLFPFGSGFGTFASRLSGVYYSPLYDMYNLSGVNGLNRADYGYISDSFWPMIIGQNGFIGLLLFVAMLFILYLKISKTRKYNINYYVACLMGLSYLLIASMAESCFVHPIMMPIAWWFGLLIGNAQIGISSNKEIKDKNK